MLPEEDGHLSVITSRAAALHVPVSVGLGYAVGYGLGEYVARLERVVGEIEHLVLIGAILAALALMGWRALRAARARREL